MPIGLTVWRKKIGLNLWFLVIVRQSIILLEIGDFRFGHLELDKGVPYQTNCGHQIRKSF